MKWTWADFRPADWVVIVIELLVLGVIVFEVWHSLARERQDARRKKLVEQRIAEMREALSRGAELQHTVPGSGDPRVGGWAQAADRWGRETGSLLKSYSAQAETAFLHAANLLPIQYGSVGAAAEYTALLSRLNNLRGIMEKPEIYF